MASLLVLNFWHQTESPGPIAGGLTLLQVAQPPDHGPKERLENRWILSHRPLQRAAGTPALGVGPGNTPAYIAGDADVDAAARAIVASKPYDNGLVCGAEHNLVVDLRVRDALVAALETNGAAVLDSGEAKRFCALSIDPATQAMVPQMIGQGAAAIAAVASIARAHPIKLIVVPAGIEQIDRHGALAREKLAPVLSLFTVYGEEEAFALCRRILVEQGSGHTAIVHTRSMALADRFGLAMPASRILVNSPGT